MRDRPLFGYNRKEADDSYLSVDELIPLFADVLSRGGNLLLNVGPMADGTIPAPQVDRLRAIGESLRG